MEITMGMSRVRAEGGDLPVFVARPAAGGPHPGVIVVMEAFGLNQHIKGIASRIAGEGYVAVAPDLYYREPNSVVGYDQLPEAIRLMTGLWDSKILQDVDAVVAFLQKQPDMADRIGMTGFCMGGRITFLAACNNSAINAAAPFYGGGIAAVMQRSDRTPIPPLDYAEKLQAPMLLFFGGKDAFIPLDQVHKIEARLAEVGKDAETVVYPEADHGFFCDERSSYNAEAATDAWGRLLTFFAKHLRAQLVRSLERTMQFSLDERRRVRGLDLQRTLARSTAWPYLPRATANNELLRSADGTLRVTEVVTRALERLVEDG